MTRNPYDEQVATAFKAVREIPHSGLTAWREALGRYLEPGMTVVDIGAGTGAYASAFTGWFGVDVVAVEPSDAMRSHIPSGIRALAGNATELPLPEDSADAAWLSLVIHHIPDLEAAAREIRRVLRPGAPVLLRQGFPGRVDGIELIKWFPETTRVVSTLLTLDETCAAFAAAGFGCETVERVREVPGDNLEELLGQLNALRAADTTLRALSDEEFERGKERIAAADAATPRENWLDLVVLR
jgi:SAM-dependent methyltransferase